MCIAFPQLLARAFLPSGTALYRIWSHESESRSSLCSHYYAKHHLTISKCSFLTACRTYHHFYHHHGDGRDALWGMYQRLRALWRHYGQYEQCNRPRIQNQRILTSAGSKPWNKSGGVGGRSSRPWDKRGGGGPVSKNFFPAFWASVWSKNKGGGPLP